MSRAPHSRGSVARRRGTAWAAACLAGALAGCTSSKTTVDLDVSPTVVESAQRYQREYVLAAGDLIDVIVRGNAAVSRQCTLRPDGYISLPLLQDVKAEGLTVAGLADHLRTLFSARLNDPQVTVIALSVRQPMVYVLGEVGAPQPIPLKDVRTVAQALAFSGGAKVSADLSSVSVIRLTEEGRLRAITVESLEKGQPAPYMALNAILLQAEDVIFVPESQRSQFTRGVNDFVNTPLSGINQILTPYFQFKLIAVIEDNNN